GFVSWHHGSERKSPVSAGQHFSAADEIELCGSHSQRRHPENGPRADAVPRGRNNGWAEAQQISQPLLWTRRMRTKRRMRYSRCVRFADRAHLSGHGYRKPDPAHKFDCSRNYRRSGNWQSFRRALHRFADDERLHGARESCDCCGLDARIRATAFALQIAALSERARQLERSRWAQFLRTRDGARRGGPGQEPRRKTSDAGRWPSRWFLSGAFSQSHGKTPEFH